jgi:hypothetical protein
MRVTKWEQYETVHQLFIDFEKVYESVRKEYSILMQLGVPMELIRLDKMRLNETYRTVSAGKYLSANFPIQNNLKQGDALSPLLFNFPLEYANMKVQENHVELKLNGTR